MKINYNIGKNNSMYNKHHSEKTKEKISKALKDKFVGKNNPFYNKHHTKKTKKHLSKITIERYKIEENPFKNKHHTLKTRKLMSEKAKERFKDPKNHPMYGKSCSLKTKKLISKGNSFPKGNLINRHHLDLNKKNNKINNILLLTLKKHQQFHRLIYRYLLEKFGIKEIKKYIKWFDKKYGLK